MGSTLLHITPPEPTMLHGMPLLRLGFRPFYLLATLFAILAIPSWLLVFFSVLPWSIQLPPLLWHAHELLFGFASAVIIGFLLTAGKAWTGLPTPRGTPLAALALLWIAARVAIFIAPQTWFAVLDTALLPIVAVIFARLLLKAGNKRNFPLAGILLLLGLTNLGFHLSTLGIINVDAKQFLLAALSLIILIECVIAGRVIPAFTMSVNPTLKVAPLPMLEKVLLSTTASGLALWVLSAPQLLVSLLLFIAAVAHSVRLSRWKTKHTLRRPILLVLHLSYAWIPIGLALLAAAQLGWMAQSAGIHALAVGATGGLIISMVTRTARGHTGRPLQAARDEVAAYCLILGAAFIRVFLPLIAPDLYVMALVLSGVMWSCAFLLYLLRYAPWLMQPRIDNKDG